MTFCVRVNFISSAATKPTTVHFDWKPTGVYFYCDRATGANHREISVIRAIASNLRSWSHVRASSPSVRCQWPRISAASRSQLASESSPKVCPHHLLCTLTRPRPTTKQQQQVESINSPNTFITALIYWCTVSTCTASRLQSQYDLRSISGLFSLVYNKFIKLTCCYFYFVVTYGQCFI